MTNDNNEPIKPSLPYLTTIKLNNVEVPEFTESINTNGWINFGVDNLYPQYLIGLSNKSSKHSSILKHKANFISGNGWKKANLSLQAITFLKNANNIEMDLDDIGKKISYDYELFGAFSLEIVWTKDRTSIASINYINPSKVRIAPADEKNLVHQRENYYVSDNWQKSFYGLNKTEAPIYYAGFSTIDRSQPKQLLYVKQGQSACEYYGIPTYIPCVNYCELDNELSKYHLNNVKNGFSANTVFTFISGASPEEMDDEVRRLRREYEGTEGKKIIFTFADSKESTPQIQQLNKAQAENLFKDMNDSIETNIYQAHQVTNPGLFGVFQTGKLDNTSNLVESMAIFQSMYIDHKQQVIEKIFNKLAQINGVPDTLYLEKYKLKVQPLVKAQDLMFVLDSTITNAQKQAAFMALGFSYDEAIKLCPDDAPTPAAPVKVAPTSTVQKPSTDVPKP